MACDSTCLYLKTGSALPVFCLSDPYAKRTKKGMVVAAIPSLWVERCFLQSPYPLTMPSATEGLGTVHGSPREEQSNTQGLEQGLYHEL